MKRFLVVLFLLSSFFASSQPVETYVKSSSEPWRYGLRGGVSYDGVSLQQGVEYKFGYKLGLVAEKRLVYNLYFQPAMTFHKKGYAFEQRFHSKGDVDAMVIELAANLLLKFGDARLGKGFYIGVSPYVSFGVGGKTKVEDLRNTDDNWGVIEDNSFSLHRMRTMDIGFLLGIGYDFNHSFEMGAYYCMGLQSTLRSANFMWRGFQLNLSYFF